jgi:hypothetical protein
MAFIYTQAQLKSDINRGIQGKIGMLISDEDTMNETVRSVNSKMELRSAKRRVALSPELYNGVFEYAAPADLMGKNLIDLPAQAKREDGEFFLVPAEEFRRSRGSNTSDVGDSGLSGDNFRPYSYVYNGTGRKGEVAIDDYNGQQVLLVDSRVDSKSVIVSELDGLASGASADWALFGDGENVAKDDADFIKGAGSLKWDISSAGGTTAGIQNSSVNSLDVSDYLGGTSSFFLYAKINSPTNITNYKLRFGSDSSNYHEQTVTTQHDGTAFVAGWNLLRFPISSLTDTGTPVDTALTYFVMYMTKTAGKVSETDYKFDWLVLKKGSITNVAYYTKYGWQTAAGAYQENSSTSSDLLVADTDEYNIIVAEGRVIAAQEVDLSETKIRSLKSDRNDLVEEYMIKNPSEAKLMTSGYYDYSEETTIYD